MFQYSFKILPDRLKLIRLYPCGSLGQSISFVFEAWDGHFAATLQSDVVGIWSRDLGIMATLSVRQKMSFFCAFITFKSQFHLHHRSQRALTEIVSKINPNLGFSFNPTLWTPNSFPPFVQHEGMTSAYLLEDKGQSLVEVVFQPPREHLLFLWWLRVEPGSNQPLHVHIFIAARDHWLGSPHRPFTRNSGSLTELQITYTLSFFCMNWMRNIISTSKWYCEKGDILTKTKINSYNQGDKIQWWNTDAKIGQKSTNSEEQTSILSTNTHRDNTHKHCRSPQEDQTQRQHTQTLQITSGRSNTKTKHKDNTHKCCRSP